MDQSHITTQPKSQTIYPKDMEDIRKIERKIKIHLSKKKRRMKIEEDKKQRTKIIGKEYGNERKVDVENKRETEVEGKNREI